MNWYRCPACRCCMRRTERTKTVKSYCEARELAVVLQRVKVPKKSEAA